jgi:hypothetical protein
MSSARKYGAACSLGGRLYVVGGMDEQRKRLASEGLGRLGQAGEGWLLDCAPHALKRPAPTARPLAPTSRLPTRPPGAEAYDPREGRWRHLRSMPSARSSCGLAAVGDKLYAVGGAEADEVILDAVECYVPAADSWLRCAPISCPRTGLSVCAL